MIPTTTTTIADETHWTSAAAILTANAAAIVLCSLASSSVSASSGEPFFNVQDTLLLLSPFLALVAPIVFGDTLIGVSAAGGSLPSDVSVARAKRVQEDNSLVGFETESEFESEFEPNKQQLKLELSLSFSCQKRIRGSKLKTTVVAGGHKKGETAAREEKWCTKFALCRPSPTNSYSALFH